VVYQEGGGVMSGAELLALLKQRLSIRTAAEATSVQPVVNNGAA
jgi:hypothetical protein